MSDTNLDDEYLNSLDKETLVSLVSRLQREVDKHRLMRDFTWKQVNALLTRIPLGLAIVNEEGLIEATNAQLREMFEKNATDLFGMSIHALFPDLGALRTKNKPKKCTAHLDNGLTFSVELSITEIFQDGKKLCVHVKDISESQRVLEYKMAMASMVSHDLRTPLTTMRSVLTSIEDGLYGNLSDDGSQAVKWALVSSQHMNTILANVLDIEKFDSTGLDFEPVETSINRIVTRTIDLCRRYAEEAEVLITTDIENCRFFADEEKVVRIMVNLMTNAVKFSQPGRTVKLTAGLDELEVFFSIKDQGRGIPEDQKELIFNRFQQFGRNSERRKPGFGLGLAISKLFAEIHGGTISVESDGRHGSTFTVRLPLDAQHRALSSS
jgi:signal transduction histidine kinase